MIELESVQDWLIRIQAETATIYNADGVDALRHDPGGAYDRMMARWEAMQVEREAAIVAARDAEWRAGWCGSGANTAIVGPQSPEELATFRREAERIRVELLNHVKAEARRQALWEAAIVLDAQPQCRDKLLALRSMEAADPQSSGTSERSK